MPRHPHLERTVAAQLAGALFLVACAAHPGLATATSTGDDAGLGATDAGAVETPDAGPDAGDTVNATALCPEPGDDSLYDGVFPTNPYGAVAIAGSCELAKHDAIVLLGCPSNADGSGSFCQHARVTIALALQDAGFGDDFIVSGAAVHNAYVEADELKTLLLEGGVAPEHVFVEPRARHTDENLYYSTLVMESHGWKSAIVVSEDPGQLVMTALCDSNCCVRLGRLTVMQFNLAHMSPRLGHYARLPWGGAFADAECAQLERPTKGMCTKLSSRLACAGRLQLPP